MDGTPPVAGTVAVVALSSGMQLASGVEAREALLSAGPVGIIAALGYPPAFLFLCAVPYPRKRLLRL